MLPLDDRTAERVAAVIVDVGGPYERKSYELEPLLRRAGWTPAPEYDGTPRVPWLTEQLIENRDDHARIERLLCRVCDPVEHDDGRVIAEQFREQLNEKLDAEGLVISLVDGRPVLGEVGADGAAHYSAPENLAARLPLLIADATAVDRLLNRAREAELCEQAGAHTMAIIGIGSFVEGLLYSLFMERDEKIREEGFIGTTGRKFKPDKAGLQIMLDTAHERDWVQSDAKNFADHVVEFRNFVHPAAELRGGVTLDDDTVMMCWAPVRALLNDLEEHLPAVS
ncbi:hypothetical protein [Saccharopolyspora sp. 6M]|uniref:hypothetical protein n=1 Tax=Saccharopolyspora sp. 6M TaxID=2877237 RepID=UPI001CD20C2C|nr:hypothetical protein [Saccharopolyspora sp. 6M]MCA1229565.1 hypothetical protein [Saccharopolyspora sp. 6M]